jgi:hypothetical protein
VLKPPDVVSLFDGISINMCPPALALAASTAACKSFCYEGFCPAEELCIDCILYKLSVAFRVFNAGY